MKMSWNRAMAVTGLLLGAYAAVRSQVAATQSGRVDQFENAEAKVWKTVILPHQPLAMHRHDHPRIVVALTDGKLDLVDSDGGHDVHVWEKDHAYWLPAMAPGAMHSDVNAGEMPMEVMVVELEKAR
jgi:beta-alanine degradation protein BauB